MVSGLKISVLQHTLTHCQYDSLLIILVSEKIPKLSRRQPIRTHQQTMIQVMAQLYNDYFSRIIMPRRSTLTKPWPLFHSFSTEKMNSPGNESEYTCSPESKKRLAIVDFPFREQETTNGNHDWVRDRTLLVATWVPWPQAWHSPPSRRKGRRASQWNFRKLSFEHLTSCGHSHENPKFLYVYMALSENSVPSKACCIRGYDSRYVSEVCFGGMFRGMFRPPLLKSWVWFVVWFAGMIRGHDSGYDSRKCNMHVIIDFVYAISGNTHMIIWHICVYDLGRCKEIPIHQTVRSLQRPCHASIVPRRHPPCKTTGCGVFHVSWDHHFKSAWLLVAWMIGTIHTQNELKVLWHSSWLELNMTWPEKRR